MHALGSVVSSTGQPEHAAGVKITARSYRIDSPASFQIDSRSELFRYRIDNHIEEIHIEQSIIYHIEETAARHRKACGVKDIFNVVLLVFFFPHIQDALRDGSFGTCLGAVSIPPTAGIETAPRSK